jgi:hypothetical protein
LLVESGSRAVLEGLIPSLRGSWCGGVPIDVATCRPGAPRGLDEESARLYRLDECRELGDRLRLLRRMVRRGYTQVGLVCSGEPILATWKCLLTWAMPAKVFVINENGDYFWLDRNHLGALARFLVVRSGLGGAGAVRSVARLATFPFALGYLLLYAAVIHARRALRFGSRAGTEWTGDSGIW